MNRSNVNGIKLDLRIELVVGILLYCVLTTISFTSTAIAQTAPSRVIQGHYTKSSTFWPYEEDTWYAPDLGQERLVSGLSVNGSSYVLAPNPASPFSLEKELDFRYFMRADIAPPIIFFKLQKRGEVFAFSDNPVSVRALASLREYPDWVDHFAPELPNVTTLVQNPQEADYQESVGLTLTRSASTVEIPNWPGIPYYEMEGFLPVLYTNFQCECLQPNCQDPFIWIDVAGFHWLRFREVHNYKRKPGNEPGPKQPINCNPIGSQTDTSGDTGSMYRALGSQKIFTGALNFATGNILLSLDDPVKTRGFPLSNRIHVNSQAVELNRSMGNASFTYDIHVLTPNSPTADGRWVVVDGDGQRLDFGDQNLPAAGTGIFSSLTLTSGGYTLSQAGPPEQLRRADNFTYRFSESGSLEEIIDPAENHQQLNYLNDKLQEVLDLSSGKAIEFQWTADRITQVIENGGPETTLTYSGNLKQIASLSVREGAGGPAKSMSFTYSPGSDLLESFTRDSNPASTQWFDYEFDDDVNLASLWGTTNWIAPSYREYSNVQGASRRTIDYSYDEPVTYDFDQNSDLIRVTSPAAAGSTGNSVITMNYVNRLMTSWNDGATSLQFEYEPTGLLKKIIRPDNSFIEYGWSGTNLTTVTDSIGRLLTIRYENSAFPNLSSSISDVLNNTWTVTRNSFGQITEVIPPSGSPSGKTTYTYEEDAISSRGWLKSIRDALNNEVRFETFTELGDVTSKSTDPDPLTPLSRIVRSRTLDAARRVLTITNPDNTTVNYGYSGNNLESIQDEAGTQKTYTYCAECLALESVTAPLSHALNWEWDNKLLRKFRDARGKETVYEYGDAKELTVVTLPDASHTSYEYDEVGRTKQVTNARGQVVQYSYDNLGRRRTESFPTTSEPTHTYSYRSDDSLESVIDSVGSVTYEYYPNRLVKAEVYNYQSSGLSALQRVEYEYWPDNALKKIIWKNGAATVGTWEYSYDAAGRMSSVKSFNQTNVFSYDGEGKLSKQINHNGTSTSYIWNDNRGWPTSIVHSKGTIPFATYALEYDQGANTVGNLSKTTELYGNSVSYEYDALYRLTSETRAGANAYSNTYGYDLAGNLLTLNSLPFADYDDANKISNLSGGDLVNDLDGELISVTGAGIPASTFSWNTQGGLSGLTSGSTTVSYKYDALGHRVMQQQGSIKRFYIYAGSQLLGEMENNATRVAYTWGTDGLVSERLFGALAVYATVSAPGVVDHSHAISKELDDTGVSGYATASQSPIGVKPQPIGDLTLWYHYGPQAETRYLTDQQGNISDSYLYDGYGKPIFASSVYYNPHRYGGKFGYHSNLNPAGLLLAGARWYSPHLKRWVSRDPIRYNGGVNLYEYVLGNPVNLVDPSGLEAGDDDDDGIPDGLKPPVLNPVAPGGGADIDHNGKPDFPITGGGGGGRRGWGDGLPVRGGPPNGSLSNGRGDEGTIRDYGSNGVVTRDNDYGHNHKGSGDPHIHDWVCDKDGIPRRRKGRPPGEGE